MSYSQAEKLNALLWQSGITDIEVAYAERHYKIDWIASSPATNDYGNRTAKSYWMQGNFFKTISFPSAYHCTGFSVGIRWDESPLFNPDNLDIKAIKQELTALFFRQRIGAIPGELVRLIPGEISLSQQQNAYPELIPGDRDFMRDLRDRRLSEKIYGQNWKVVGSSFSHENHILLLQSADGRHLKTKGSAIEFSGAIAPWEIEPGRLEMIERERVIALIRALKENPRKIKLDGDNWVITSWESGNANLESTHFPQHRKFRTASIEELKMSTII